MAGVEFTGVTVCFNEARHLSDCLQRLRFCREIVVVDLGSSDGSREIAAAAGARVVPHAWVPVVEEVRAFAAAQATTEWIAFVDPDQMLPDRAEPAASEIIRNDATVGIVGIPMQNYFRGKGLEHGRWGGVAMAHPVFLHRDRVEFSSAVHQGIAPKPGFHSVSTRPRESGVIVHHWADSWSDLLRKHERYLAVEGESRYRRGERTSRLRTLLSTAAAFGSSAFLKGGVLDGFDGLMLSVLAAHYVHDSGMALLREQEEAQGATARTSAGPPRR